MTRRALLAVSGAQLMTQLIGLAVALGRRLPYDVQLVGMRGEPGEIGRDLWDKGTALSAPVTMLGLQTVATTRLALVSGAGGGSGGSLLGRLVGGTAAARALGVLGALNVCGYLGERVVRDRLRPGGWDPVETPVAAVSLSLAAAMGALGLSPGSLRD